jgi:hypothetical protein
LSTNNIILPTIFLTLFLPRLNYVSLHRIIITCLLSLFIYTGFSSTFWDYSLLMSVAPSSVINLPLVHESSLSLVDKGCGYYSSQLNSNTLETKSFMLLNYNSSTHQQYNINPSDILIFSTTQDYYNILVLSILLALTKLLWKSLRNTSIIKF